jgi:hypothetical protein
MAKIGRMLLMIIPWFGVALFGSTALLSVFNAYAVATGFPTEVTAGQLLLIATTNGLATALCLFIIRKLRRKRDIGG